MMKRTPEDDIEATDPVKIESDSICEQEKIAEAPAVEITPMEITPEIVVPVESSQSSRKRLIMAMCNVVLAITIVVLCCVLFIPRKDSVSISVTVSNSQNCGVPQYEQYWGITCHDILDDPQYPNSYWDNTHFLCRLRTRPCDPSRYTRNSNVFNFEFIYDFAAFTPGDAAEVWVAIGNTDPSACFAFRAEGHWYVLSRESEEYFPSMCDGREHGNWCESLLSQPFVANSESGDGTAPDVNDYQFGSLHCCEGSEVYIIVDGVLVESCPHRVAEECRNC